MLSIRHYSAELFYNFVHLLHGTRAVYQLAHIGVHVLVRQNETQQRDRLASAGGHLQQAMPAIIIQGLFQKKHVLILLWIYVVIRKEHFQLLNLDDHRRTIDRERTCDHKSERIRRELGAAWLVCCLLLEGGLSSEYLS